MVSIIKDVFGTVDYVVFAAMLVISASIGIWYAYADRKKSSTQEFLMGGRSLSILPVAMSIMSSFISAISLLGAPAEIYRFGTMYMLRYIGTCITIPVTAHLYLPVYYRLGLTSAYEYLEIRFHRLLRVLGSGVFVIHMVTYMSIVLYAPALALAEVTGLPLETSVISVGVICTFYTSIGGIKAVVWTDFFQTLMMYAAMLLVIIKGSSAVGGIQEVWKISMEGERIEFFRFDFDPTIRHTFWNLIIGGYVTWMSLYAANQTVIQRYLTIGTLKGAQKCLWLNLPGLVILLGLTGFSGLVAYAYYAKCDPIGAKLISKSDQILPRFVMEVLGSYPGIPGLFVSGIFSGALSTVSSGVNSLAAVVLEDFIKPVVGEKLTEVWATRLSKTLALAFGLTAVLFAFVAQSMGGILQTSVTIVSTIGGPMLGLFTLGVFFPYANSVGAAAGLLTGVLVSSWLVVGSLVNKPYHPAAPMSYENCPELYFNATNIDIRNSTLTEINKSNDHIFYMYKISYMWLSVIGFAVVLIVGNSISLLAGANKRAENRLLSPFVIWLNERFSTGKNEKIIDKEIKEMNSKDHSTTKL